MRDLAYQIAKFFSDHPAQYIIPMTGGMFLLGMYWGKTRSKLSQKALARVKED